MGSATYTARVIVLRKTKLSESDLILTMLAEDGSQLRAVAKGARKPQSSFSSRLELYCVADVLNARGKNLDIVKEARLIDGNVFLRGDMMACSAAACMAELLERISQDNLCEPRLFALMRAGLSALNRADETQMLAITAAFLLKALSFSGLRPCFNSCVICSQAIDMKNPDAQICFSTSEGGTLCDNCAHTFSGQGLFVRAACLAQSHALLYATFDEILHLRIDPAVVVDVLQLCRTWINVHVGCDLKSLRFLLAAGEL